MESSIPASPHRAGDAAWQEVEDLVDELERLALASSAPARFHLQLLERTVTALAAMGGAVWIVADTGLARQAELGGDDLFAAVDSAGRQLHVALLQKLLNEGEPRAVPAESFLNDERAEANPTPALLLVCPFGQAGQSAGVLEVYQRPGVSQAACVGALRFLSAVGELLAGFHDRLQLEELRDRSDRWADFQAFAEAVHQNLDLARVAGCTANDGRRLVDCDRLTVAARYRSAKYRISAISGVASIDRRSTAVRQLETLIRAVAAVREPLWFDGSRDRLPPQIAEPLEQYLDSSHIRTLGIVPLFPPLPAAPEEQYSRREPRELPPFVLVVERFDTEVPLSALQQRTGVVARQCEPALRNARTWESLPLLWLHRLAAKFVDRFRLRQLPATVLVLGAVAAVVAALVLVPADFRIEGTGALQPEIRQHVFAAVDGNVSLIAVDPERDVQQGDLLVELRNDELDYEFSRVLGELQTASRRLATVQASRLNSNPQTADAVEEYNRLTAEEEELKEQIRSLTAQQQILDRRRQAMQHRSPIAGRVLTWNAEELLETRPVRRGQQLLTVASLDGPWIIEMAIADDHIRHVIEAQQAANGKPLPVTFLVATDPGTTCTGTLERISLTTEADRENRPAVRVTVRIDPETVPGLRPGATVIPQVHCGRRAIGYVWFHDLWDAVRTRLLF